jgi:hypothetical protein
LTMLLLQRPVFIHSKKWENYNGKYVCSVCNKKCRDR